MGGENDVAEDDEAHRCREEGCRREQAIRGLLKRHDDKRLSIGTVEEIAQDARQPGLKLKRRGKAIKCENIFGRYSHV